MQTFLPYPDVASSASVLDNKRLGKQRVEAWQVLRALEYDGFGWSNHPAVRMWNGYEELLRVYLNTMIDEWEQRGFRNTVETEYVIESLVSCPPWWNGPIHVTHRAALLAKDPAWYSQFGWTEQPRVAYHWPTKELTS